MNTLASHFYTFGEIVTNCVSNQVFHDVRYCGVILFEIIELGRSVARLVDPNTSTAWVNVRLQ